MLHGDSARRQALSGLHFAALNLPTLQRVPAAISCGIVKKFGPLATLRLPTRSGSFLGSTFFLSTFFVLLSTQSGMSPAGGAK